MNTECGDARRVEDFNPRKMDLKKFTAQGGIGKHKSMAEYGSAMPAMD